MPRRGVKIEVDVMNNHQHTVADSVFVTDRVLRLPEVIRTTGLGRSSLYAKVKEGSFPEAVRISRRAVGWKASEVAAWVNSLPGTT